MKLLFLRPVFANDFYSITSQVNLCGSSCSLPSNSYAVTNFCCLAIMLSYWSWILARHRGGYGNASVAAE